MSNNGIVTIHGKEYKTVSLRVEEFRRDHAAWSILTEALRIDDDAVVVKASIADEDGRVLATGHGEEYRQSSSINKASALENCETSAIGRALAFIGYAGSEIASADELVSKLGQQANADEPKKISTAQLTRFHTIASNHNWSKDEVDTLISHSKYGFESSKDITRDKYEALCNALTSVEVHDFIIELVNKQDRKKSVQAAVEGNAIPPEPQEPEDILGDGMDQYGETISEVK